MQGLIVRWFTNRAYGFLELDDGSTAFLHFNDVEPPQHLGVGDLVDCQLLPTQRGLRAVQAHVLGNRLTA